MCQSLFLISCRLETGSFIKEETLTQVFSCNFAKFVRTSFYRTPLVAASIFVGYFPDQKIQYSRRILLFKKGNNDITKFKRRFTGVRQPGELNSASQLQPSGQQLSSTFMSRPESILISQEQKGILQLKHPSRYNAGCQYLPLC